MVDDNLKQYEIQRLSGSSKVLEPVEGLLSDDEILIYAPKSVVASKIRLSRGMGGIIDKSKVNSKACYGVAFFDFLAIFSAIVFIPLNMVISYFLLILFCLIASIIFLVYILFIKDYSSLRRVSNFNDLNKDSFELEDVGLFNDYRVQIFELKDRYYRKEGIVRDLLFRNFSSSKVTYDRFIATVDNSNRVFNNQFDALINIIRLSDSESVEIEGEIERGVSNLNLMIDKMGLLVDELVLNESHSNDGLNDLDDEMNDLINSLKNY